MKKTMLLAILMTLTLFSRAQSEHGHEHDNDHEHEGHCGSVCTFTYGAWSPCVNGVQTRPYTATPSNCVPVADSIQRACVPAIKWLYYNTQYQSVRVVCLESPGVLTVTNAMGTVTRNYPFRAGIQGNWISVADLPPGLYYAVAYGASTTFIR